MTHSVHFLLVLAGVASALLTTTPPTCIYERQRVFIINEPLAFEDASSGCASFTTVQGGTTYTGAIGFFPGLNEVPNVVGNCLAGNGPSYLLSPPSPSSATLWFSGPFLTLTNPVNSIATQYCLAAYQGPFGRVDSTSIERLGGLIGTEAPCWESWPAVCAYITVQTITDSDTRFLPTVTTVTATSTIPNLLSTTTTLTYTTLFAGTTTTTRLSVSLTTVGSTTVVETVTESDTVTAIAVTSTTSTYTYRQTERVSETTTATVTSVLTSTVTRGTVTVSGTTVDVFCANRRIIEE